MERPTALPLFRAEHDELRASARRFVDREIVPHVEEWERAEDFPRELFRRAGEAGFLGLKFAPAVGGSGPDPLAQAVWVEELARSLAGGLAADLGATTDLAAVYVDAAGSGEQRRRFLPPLLSGERIGALAITEPEAGSDVAGLRSRARRGPGDVWRLDGTKVFITNGAWCDDVVVAALVDPADGAPTDDPHGRITLFLVPAEAPGVSRRRLPMLGWRTSHTGEIVLDGVELDDDRRLGEVGGGFGQIMRAFAWERLVMALGAVATAERTLELGISYARERRAFDRPVASFQVWRHRFAELATRIATGRALTYRALRLVVARQQAASPGAGAPAGDEVAYAGTEAADAEVAHAVDEVEVTRTVAMAKLFTQRLAFEVADECLQVHGGAGYMMESPIQRVWRDTRLGPIGGGTDEIMREIVARTYGW